MHEFLEDILFVSASLVEHTHTLSLRLFVLSLITCSLSRNQLKLQRHPFLVRKKYSVLNNGPLTKSHSKSVPEEYLLYIH